MKNILFVCTGNTCRSSMAEAMFKAMLNGSGLNIEVASAGTSVFFKGGASQQAIDIMKERDIDLSGHSSRQVLIGDIKKADLILTMTQGHKQMVRGMAPEFADKVFTLKEYVINGIRPRCDENGPAEQRADTITDAEAGLPSATHIKADTDIDIQDPFGGTLEDYRLCSLEIEEALKKLINKIKDDIKNEKEGPKLNIAIGSDHGGFELKENIKLFLQQQDIAHTDFGTFSTDSVDYPEFAKKVADVVAKGDYSRGILCCGTGIGISIAANKIPGIRAALCGDCFSAKMSRRHNDANILCMGGRVIGSGLGIEIVKVWLNTGFDGGRHQRRIDKIED